MVFKFEQAKAEELHLRCALVGPAGSGKTWTALTIAVGLVGGIDKYDAKDVCLVDSERRSALKYVRRKGRPRVPGAWDFTYLSLPNHNPKTYTEVIQSAQENGFKVLIVDSLSHAWVGKEGALELVDRAAKKSSSNNSFVAWREVTPLHNALVDALMSARMHVIFTLRTKMEYAIEKDERTGKTTVRKIGLQPVMRDGIEYEADIVCDIDLDNTLTISKTRCAALSGQVFRKPGDDFICPLLSWLGEPPPAPEQSLQETTSQALSPIGGNGQSKIITGQDLLKRIQEKDLALAKDGRCSAGQLVQYVMEYGLAKGLKGGIAEWPKNGFVLAVAATKEFEANHPKPAAREPGDDPE